MILALISRLCALKKLPAFPDPDLAPERDALNCIRILTRILPFIYEADNLEAWEDKFFWAVRRRRTKKGLLNPEVLFDEAHPETEGIEEKQNEEEFEDAKPLGEELLDTLIDLLFLHGFTLPYDDRSKSKVSYSIWSSGVGCNTAMSSSKEFESNRTEILKLLLVLSSKSMYMPASKYLRSIACYWLTSRRRSTYQRDQGHNLHCILS